MGRRSRRKRGRIHPPRRPAGTVVTGSSGDVFVEARPLAAWQTAGFRSLRVARHTAETFVLSPSLGTNLLGLVIATFSGAFLVGTVGWVCFWVAAGFPPGSKHGHPGCFVLFFPLPALLFLVFGLSQVGSGVRFDRRTGRITRRVLWTTTEDRPLTDVIAVQCLHAGERRGRVRNHHAYQLNLVVKRAGRVNLSEEPDGEWVRTTATDLAAFLGVPLADHYELTGTPSCREQPPLRQG